MEDKTEEKVKDLKVESLDDLFEDDIEETKKEPVKISGINEDNRINEVNEINGMSEFNELNNIEGINKETTNIPEFQEEIKPLDLNDFNDAPILPQEDEDEYDLQKELEAKFDELFGKIEN